MNVENDMHSIFCNGIGCDVLEELDLIAAIEVTPRDFDPCSIGRGDSQDIYASSGQFVDISRLDEGCVTAFEDRATLGTKLGTASPFVGCAGAILRPPRWINDGFLGEPTPKIDSVRIEGLPVDVTFLSSLSRATSSEAGEGEGCCEDVEANHDG